MVPKPASLLFLLSLYTHEPLSYVNKTKRPLRLVPVAPTKILSPLSEIKISFHEGTLVIPSV